MGIWGLFEDISMKHFFYKYFPVTLAIWPYTFLPVFFLIPGNSDIVSAFLYGYIILTVVIYLLNILYAGLYRKDDKLSHLAFWDMLLKLIHVPFYILMLLFSIFSFVIGVVPMLIFVIPFVLIALFVIDLLLMLTSSSYGFSVLLKANRERAASKSFVVVNILLHCFFVTDIISSIIVFVKLRKLK